MSDPQAGVDAVLAGLERDGFAVLPDALTAEQVANARSALDAILVSTPQGRSDFEGRRTRRVYALFGKTRVLDALALHPGVLAVLDRVLGPCQLSAPAAISIGPGESAQALHRDDAIYPVARPHDELVATVVFPLVDFHEANGGTRIVPGSHAPENDAAPIDESASVGVEVAAGSALFYVGSLLHGGGANRTDVDRLGVALHFSRAWLRPAENQVLSVPPALARTLPQRLQELLGYDIAPPFLGNVDGRHPRRLLSTQETV